MKKGTLQKQRDATDCGATCLASVSAHHGLHISVSRIRLWAGTDKQGTSLYGLMKAAKRMNFQARGVKAHQEHIGEIPLPAIFHLILESGIQHFVVVYRVTQNRVMYMDPARGKIIRQVLPAFQKLWTGVALILLPLAGFHGGGRYEPVFKRFWILIRPHRSILLQALLGAMIYTILGLTTSIYVQKIIDFVLPDANRKLMSLLGLLMVVILAFQMLAGYFKSLLALRTGQQIDAQLILGYYRHLLNLPQAFFDSMRVGEIISRVHDAVKIRTFINDTALQLVIHALSLFLSITVMFLYYRKLALVMLLMIPLYLILYIISNRINAKWQRNIMETGSALESQLVESVNGIGTIRGFGAEHYFNQQTEKKFIPLMRAVYKTGKAGLVLNHISELNTRLITVILLWAGSYFVMDRQLSAGALLSFYALAAYFTTPVQALIGANKIMQDAIIAADRLFEIIDLETEKEKDGTLGMTVIPAGDLEFRNVHFRYGSGNKVFCGLDLTIEHHRITAIVGESGSGKSTLLSLLQRLYPLTEGNISIGGTDIRYIHHAVLCRIIAPVPQQTDLFQGTIVSNIALGDDEPDMESILQLCKRLGLHEFIDRLPGRYQAEIREQGANLSGGQKQRIAMARALYRDPEILILDEATSSLDPESEQKVLETLQWFYSRKKTIIIIAHRLTTIKYCHRILLLQGGKLAASGPHEQLMRESEVYAQWLGLM
ncbi:MAG: peptidase domain-containing ABC transporter [Bacteroidota bacterium]|nr:peptidase domain-containing ABC transporter [Bacteroidota bacterium]MDP4211649.1 peptidase domain-containing ABC transporter [Bacteroidota bacterium]